MTFFLRNDGHDRSDINEWIYFRRLRRRIMIIIQTTPRTELNIVAGVSSSLLHCFTLIWSSLYEMFQNKLVFIWKAIYPAVCWYFIENIQAECVHFVEKCPDHDLSQKHKNKLTKRLQSRSAAEVEPAGLKGASLNHCKLLLANSFHTIWTIWKLPTNNRNPK